MASTSINFKHPSESMQTDALKEKTKRGSTQKLKIDSRNQKQRSNHQPGDSDHQSKDGIQHVNNREADIRNYPASCHTQAKDSLL